MKKILLSILLLHTVAAFAQPAVSAEFSSDPLAFTNFPSFLPGPAIPMAKDRTGIAIAWLMPVANGDRISVTRLDVNGHFTGQVQTIPTASSESVYVVAPSIAAVSHGDGFTLAWLEIVATSPPSGTSAVYCRLDRDLKPTTPAVLTVLPQPWAEIPAPAVVRSGKTTWISVGGSAWELHDDGSLGAPLDAGMSATDMTVATDFPQIVALGHFVSGSVCQPGCASLCFCPRVPVFKSSLQFTSLYSVTASKRFDFDSDAAPAIGRTGGDVALVWFQGAHAKGGAVMMSHLLSPSFSEFSTAVDQSRTIGSFGPDVGPTRPDIASDDARYVVVWRTTTPGGAHDIVGASIDPAGNIIPLSIATSAADERDPSVVSTGDGNFLVAYEKLSAGERRIAGRLVTFESRSHAVR